MFGLPSKEQRIRWLFEIAPTREYSGADITRMLGFWAGTVYPVLARLERDGFINSRWAREPAPRRMLYSMANPGGVVRLQLLGGGEYQVPIDVMSAAALVERWLMAQSGNAVLHGVTLQRIGR